MKNFSVSGIPMNLHAAYRNQMMMLWHTEFSNKAMYFPVFDFRLKNVDDDSVKLVVSNPNKQKETVR